MVTTHRCPQCHAELPADAPEGLCPECLLRRAVEGDSGPVTTTPHAAGFVAPAPADLARHFPQLEVLELLGQGGMGAVYKARQTKLDRLVALKVLPPEWGTDPAFAERFGREARALARLNHPHVVAVHDFGEAGGLFYFLMEYVDGPDLRQLLGAGRLDTAQALKLVPQLCDALQYAHDEGIVHRDIKPENILLDKRGRVKVADFGLAKLVGGLPARFTLTGSRQVVGTPHYMAPEQIERPSAVDHRADVYSLGVVFYEMLTGELPLGRFALPSQRAAVDARLDEVVLRALEKDPGRRYQHVSELKAGMEALAAGDRPAPAAADGPGKAAGPTVLSLPFWTSHVAVSDAETKATKGLIRFDGKELVLEYVVVSHSGWGTIAESEVQEARIPIDDIASLAVAWGWFTTSFLVRVHRLSVLAGLPGSSGGQVRLYVALKDQGTAARLIERVLRESPYLDEVEREMLRLQVKGPAAALMLTGFLAFLLYAALWVTLLVMYWGPWHTQASASAETAFWLTVRVGVIAAPVVLLAAGVLITAGRRMMRLAAYHFIVCASIWAMLPWSPAVFAGLPVGLWVLSTLSRPEVRRAFIQKAAEARPGAPGVAPPAAGPLRRMLRSVFSVFIGRRPE